MSLGFIHPSGGLFYHLRAARQHTRWENFRISLGRWLANWCPPTNELILVGPSGGYTLPTKWLNRFSSIHAYDVDRLAWWFFRRQHQVETTFHRQDLFWLNGKLSIAPLQKLIEATPNATILFSNILGQIPLEGQVTESEWQSYLTSLRSLLSERRWASYHDLYSFDSLAYPQHHDVLQQLENENCDVSSLSGLNQKVEVVDHLTNGAWTMGLTKVKLGWSLTPTSLHVIECVSV